MVREKLVRAGNIPPELLHTKALLFVRASEQSKSVEKILPCLSVNELDIYKRGRNAKSRVPKSSSVSDYKRATGLECLFGYLYLSKNSLRIEELFQTAFGDIDIVNIKQDK